MLYPLRPSRFVTALGLFALIGCNGAEQESDTDAETNETNQGTDTSADSLSSTSATDTATSTATDNATDNATDTATTGAEPVPILARNIKLDRVQANQAVGIDIARDGAWVPGAERSSYLLANRLMLLRGFFSVGEGWVPRDIRAHLTVYYPDGTIHEDDETVFIEGDSFEGNLAETFNFGLMPEQVVTGIRFEMDLWETAPGYEDVAEPDPPPRIPYDGDALIGVEDSHQILKVVIVPFNYDDGAGCKRSPDTSEETMKLFYDYMYMQDPVDELEITMHDPIDWTTKLNSFDEMNQFMSGLRFDEGAPPEVFYYGLVDPCSSGVGGAGGKAYGIPNIPPEKEQAWRRVSSGASLSNTQANIEWSAETFVHEVGHSLGRLHIDCGGAAGFDPSYPFPEGQVGEWGFGVLDYGMRHPTVNKDYMTYCHPTWIGNWGWSKLYPIIRTLSEWANEAPPAPGEDIYGGSLLVGSVYPDGHSSWITVPGAVRDEALSATDTVELRAGDTVIATQRAEVQVLPDGDITQIVVPLPENFDSVTSFEHISADSRRAIDISDVSLHHTSRALRTQ